VWRGAWDAEGAYQELDGVQHQGSAWVATDGVQAGDEPGVAASWELWVSKGDTGPQGDPGEPGPAGADGADGADGREIELQKSATHIQWRYEGEDAWTDLVALADLEGPQGPAGNDGAQGPQGAAGADGSDGADGREVELQVTATHIQWRLAGGSWQDLIALSELEGPQGQAGQAGADGADGTPQWRGAWSAGAYEAGEAVAHGGSSYVANTTTSQEPPGGDWDVLAAKGDAGSGGASAWGDLTGTLSDQTDLQNALDAKADASSLATVATTGDYADLSNRPSLGTAAAAATGDFATAAQGALADTAVQPGDALTSLSSGVAASGHVPKADGSGGINWAAESGGGGDGGLAVRHANDGAHDYTGSAAIGTLETDSGWTVTRLTFSAPPVAETGTGAWSDKESITYG